MTGRQSWSRARGVLSVGAVYHAKTPDAIEQLLESTGRSIIDSRNRVTAPRLDLFAAVMKLRLNAKPPVRRRAVAR